MTYVNLLKNDKKNKTFMDYEPGDVPKKETTTVSYTPPESYTEKRKTRFLKALIPYRAKRKAREIRFLAGQALPEGIIHWTTR